MDSSKFYIYKLNVLDEFYIGSTKNPRERFKTHKQDSKTEKYKDKKIYRKMNQIEDYKDENQLNYEILETLFDSSRLEARTREQYYIENLKPTLNSINAILNLEEQRKKKVEYARRVREQESAIDKKIRLAKKKVWYYQNREDILRRERNRYNQKKLHEFLDNQNFENVFLDNIELEEVNFNPI